MAVNEPAILRANPAKAVCLRINKESQKQCNAVSSILPPHSQPDEKMHVFLRFYRSSSIIKLTVLSTNL